MEVKEHITDVQTSENVDVIVPQDNTQVLLYGQEFRLNVPKVQDVGAISVNDIHKLKNLCEKASKQSFPFAEVSLSLSMLFFGGVLGAITGHVEYEKTFLSVLVYNICPALGIGFGVAYGFQRKKSSADITRFAEEVRNIIERISVSSKEDS